MKKLLKKLFSPVITSMGKINLKSKFSSKFFRIGSFSTLSVLIVIAVAVLINVLVAKIPTNLTKYDLTKNQFFTISEQTEKILSSLDKDVDIYLIAKSGSEDSTIKQLLERYESMNQKVKVTLKDPEVYADFTKKYTNETVADNSIIVVSGDKSKYISFYDIYVTDFTNYYTDGSYSSEFNGESCLTSAIDYVINGNLPKLYSLTGHGEKVLNSTFQSAVNSQNIQTQDLNLLTSQKIPEDADCILINSPSKDISENEKDIILDYLKNGGNMMLITDYSESQMQNLAKITEYYGVKAVDGIVFEGDASHSIRDYGNYLLPDINSHTITTPVQNAGYYVLMPTAQGIKKIDGIRNTVSVTELLTTSDKSYSKVAGYDISTMEKEDGDIDGPFAVGVAVTEKIDDLETNIVWYTTSQMLEEKVNQVVSGSNLDMFLNSIGWMCEKDSAISLHAKSLDSENLTVPSSAASLWSLVLIIVIPILLVSVGVVVVIRRKRR